MDREPSVAAQSARREAESSQPEASLPGENHPLVPEPPAEEEPSRAAADLSTESASAPSGGKSKKHKKKKKKSSTTSEQMQQLRISECDGSEPKNKELDRIDLLARALDRLKEGSSASAGERDASALSALGVVDILRARVKRHVTTVGLLDTSPSVRRDALDACQAIFLLNKYHCQLPEPPQRPHHLLWKRGPQEDSMSSLEKLQKRAGPALDFMEFLMFAANTARVLSACGRLPQAKEVMDLVERRLLKGKQRSPLFREYVGYFLDSRQSAGIDAASNPLTPEGERQLEWYASDNNISDEMTLLHLDMLHGYKVFVRVTCVESFSSPEFERFIEIIDAQKTAEMDCVCVDGFVAAGAETEAEASEIFLFLFDAAKESGLHFCTEDTVFATDKLELLGFEFSATEIVGTQV